MSSAGPAYEIRFRDDEHVQIIDLTRNGNGAESRRIPNLYRQSYLLRRESVMLSSSTPMPSATAEYHEREGLQQREPDPDTEVSSLAIRNEPKPTPTAHQGNVSTASQPIRINTAASSSVTRPLAKSAPLDRTRYDNEQSDTNFNWTTGQANKDLDMIPTVARRLAEEEAMDHLRRQEGEEAMRKAMERKAKIAAARQNANKSTPDLKAQGSNYSEQTTHQHNSSHQAKDRIRMASVDYVKDTRVANQAKHQSTSFEQRQAQNNNTRDIRKEVDAYINGTDMRNAADRRDSQPNDYPYNTYDRMGVNIKQPPKGYFANPQMNEQYSTYSTSKKSRQTHFDRGYELSHLQEGKGRGTSMSAEMNSEQDLGHDSSNENKGCCCIIS